MSEIHAIQTELEQINEKITSVQSISFMVDLAGQLAAWLAFSGEQMAIAKKKWRAAKVRAYDNYAFSKAASGLKITPSVATDYAQARSGDEESDYEHCERVNKAITHTLDVLRTCISALKAEQFAFQYSGNQ